MQGWAVCEQERDQVTKSICSCTKIICIKYTKFQNKLCKQKNVIQNFFSLERVGLIFFKDFPWKEKAKVCY